MSGSNGHPIGPHSEHARFLVRWASGHALSFGAVIDEFAVRGEAGLVIPPESLGPLELRLSQVFAKLATQGPLQDALAVLAAVAAIAGNPSDRAYITRELAIISGAHSSAAVDWLQAAAPAGSA